MPPDALPETKSAAKWTRKKICGCAACVLWLLSIACSFLIAPSSPFIWVPDFILLAGFLPLLWICPFSLVWIAFGLLTGFIGFFLLLLTNIPESALPASSHAIKKHLAEFHPCWTWMLLGAFVTICGTIRLLLNTVKYILRKSNKISG